MWMVAVEENGKGSREKLDNLYNERKLAST
jgi:hypothetical protein